MRKYERAQRIMVAARTLIGCIGWGLLGYLVMTRIDGMFWPGWLIMTTSLFVGAYSLDQMIKAI